MAVIGESEGRIVMVEKAEKDRLSVSLDRDTYGILLQKSAYKGQSLSDYIRTLIAMEPPKVA